MKGGVMILGEAGTIKASSGFYSLVATENRLDATFSQLCFLLGNFLPWFWNLEEASCFVVIQGYLWYPRDEVSKYFSSTVVRSVTDEDRRLWSLPSWNFSGC